MAKLPTINFKEAPGQYWYLNWISQTTITDKGKHMTKFHFINTAEPNCKRKYFYSKNKQEHIFPSESLSFLTIGTIYDTQTNEYIKPEDYRLDSHYMYLDRIGNLNLVDGQQPVFKNIEALLIDDIDFTDFKYYTTQLLGHHLILTSEVICNYFYFLSTQLTGRLLYNGIDSLFNLESRFLTNENKEKIGHVIYNNTKNQLTDKEAWLIAPYLFMNDDKGVKSLRSMTNNLKAFFVNNRNNKDRLQTGTYLNTELPHSANIRLEFLGRKFNLNGKGYFLASKIIGDFEKKTPYIVDEIRLDKLHQNNSTEGKDSLINIRLTRPGQTKLSKGNDNLENGSSNPNATPNEHNVPDNSYDSTFRPTITYVKREELKNGYHVNFIPNENELNGETISSGDSDPESNNILNDFNKYFGSLEKMSRFDFMFLYIEYLSEKYGITYNFKTLDTTISSRNIYNFPSGNVAVVSLLYKTKSDKDEDKYFYFYLVEFEEKGNLGFIYNSEKIQIAPITLELVVKDCLEEFSTLEPKQHIWSLIRKNKEDAFLEKYNITLGMPIEHRMINNTKKQALEDITGTIYNDRIKKLVS